MKKIVKIWGRKKGSAQDTLSAKTSTDTQWGRGTLSANTNTCTKQVACTKCAYRHSC